MKIIILCEKVQKFNEILDIISNYNENFRPAIAPPFMPIAGQIPIEFGKLTIPHIPCASAKSHRGYGSIRVKIQDEKLQKSADSKNERFKYIRTYY